MSEETFRGCLNRYVCMMGTSHLTRGQGCCWQAHQGLSHGARNNLSAGQEEDWVLGVGVLAAKGANISKGGSAARVVLDGGGVVPVGRGGQLRHQLGAGYKTSCRPWRRQRALKIRQSKSDRPRGTGRSCSQPWRHEAESYDIGGLQPWTEALRCQNARTCKLD